MRTRLAGFLIAVRIAAAALALHPENPHVFLFRGKATVLVTSGEHYGAVINEDFHYVRYLDELARHHLNLTRIWVGPYREVPGNFGIDHNTLAPQPDRFLPPWVRKGDRFDLTQWNPAYFARLRDFIDQAARRGIAVEVNLFCPYYEDAMWEVSPLNLGGVPRTEVLTLKHRDLVAIEDAMVRKIVAELKDFDNIYYEICNEPYFGGVTLDWQRHVSSVIAATEKELGARHLISQNIANGSKRVDDPDPNVAILNFHYSRPPDSIAMNYDLHRAIGNNETGFDGQDDATYRIQGWDFLMAGGALYNNLDYSFTVGHENGDFRYDAKTPGGGSAALRKQLGILKDPFDTLYVVHMQPRDSMAKLAGGTGVVRVLANGNADYALYIHHARVVADAKPRYVVDHSRRSSSVQMELPVGSYRCEWLDTKNGEVIAREQLEHSGGGHVFRSPEYSEDIALRIRR